MSHSVCRLSSSSVRLLSLHTVFMMLTKQSESKMGFFLTLSLLLFIKKISIKSKSTLISLSLFWRRHEKAKINDIKFSKNTNYLKNIQTHKRTRKRIQATGRDSFIHKHIHKTFFSAINITLHSYEK